MFPHLRHKAVFLSFFLLMAFLQLSLLPGRPKRQLKSIKYVDHYDLEKVLGVVMLRADGLTM